MGAMTDTEYEKILEKWNVRKYKVFIYIWGYKVLEKAEIHERLCNRKMIEQIWCITSSEKNHKEFIAV